MSAPAYLVKGPDDVLRSDAARKLIDELVGSGDRSLLVDEFDLDVAKLGAAIDAAQTPPFLTDRRIVVVRRFDRFSKQEEVAELVAYLADPLDSSVMVLVADKSLSATESGEGVAKQPKTPPSLTKAITAAGGEIIDSTPDGRKLDGWLAAQLKEAGLDVEPAARNKIVATVGQDAGDVVGLIERLKGAFEPGARLRLDDIEPLLGEAGDVAPWDLTDAIDKGDVALALDRLRRMMAAGDRHPLAIMATLQTHYLRMARLDGSGARGEKDAAALLGMKGSTFPAKKAIEQSRKLGGRGVRRAVELLAGADVDLRGARAWPGELVMEVLVARLARLAR
jgi:DNA polymerase-3 subunit delta